MPTTLQRLSSSTDIIDREIAAVLIEWQKQKRAAGRKGVLGYEPRDINRYGAVPVIASRVRKGSVGYEEVVSDQSYEAIVDRHPDRFDPEVVEIARRRLGMR